MSVAAQQVKYKKFDPREHPIREIHHLLLGGVAPRPIALVSSISEDGVRNLSPFSFFNAFGANPPTVAFSPSRRGRDGSLKDTFRNVSATGECVIHAVTHAMVHQASLASTEYPSDVDEFTKSGFTPIASDIVRPSRVAESPFAMECKVKQIVPLGDGPASGNLVICEVLLFHVAESILEDGVIHPNRIDLVGRNSANFYTRASGNAILEVAKPIGRTGIGYDALPEFIRRSHILSANDLAQLANCENLPSDQEVEKFVSSFEGEISENAAKNSLGKRTPEEAWLILLAVNRAERNK